MPKKKTHHRMLKSRSGVHWPTRIIHTKNIYSRPVEKTKVGREAKSNRSSA